MILDLTHRIVENMPVFPGTESPSIVQVCGFEDIGCVEHKLTMYSHTGTHMDAPAHILKEGKTLDGFNIDHFCGIAIVIKADDFEDRGIGIEHVEKYGSIMNGVDYVLINTEWSQYWGSKKYFSGFPVLSSEAAEWLSGFGLKGIGVDAISLDDVESVGFENHKVFLGKNTVIIENLTNLAQLPSDPFFFCCFPLKTVQADGSPIRAVAFIGNEPGFEL